MKTALIGYTGFIGSNLDKQFNFSHKYNTKNINEINNQEFDELVFAGLPGMKWWANSNPKIDKNIIEEMMRTLENVHAKKVIYISTIDVYENPIDVDEDTPVSFNHQPYGANRSLFEKFMLSRYKDCTSIRLPITFGSNFKKNYLFDLINRRNLKSLNLKNNVQFYDINDLSLDVEAALTKSIKVYNLATEPVALSEIVNLFFPHLLKECSYEHNFSSNMKTKYNTSGYLYRKEEVLQKIEKFIK